MSEDLLGADHVARSHHGDERGAYAASAEDVYDGQAFDGLEAISYEYGDTGHGGPFHMVVYVVALIPASVRGFRLLSTMGFRVLKRETRRFMMAENAASPTVTDQELCDLLEHELICALGCTEPIAVAYAAALARRACCGCEPEHMEVGCWATSSRTSRA